MSSYIDQIETGGGGGDLPAKVTSIKFNNKELGESTRLNAYFSTSNMKLEITLEITGSIKYDDMLIVVERHHGKATDYSIQQNKTTYTYTPNYNRDDELLEFLILLQHGEHTLPVSVADFTVINDNYS